MRIERPFAHVVLGPIVVENPFPVFKILFTSETHLKTATIGVKFDERRCYT